jgi:hypothetical protein
MGCLSSARKDNLPLRCAPDQLEITMAKSVELIRLCADSRVTVLAIGSLFLPSGSGGSGGSTGVTTNRRPGQAPHPSRTIASWRGSVRTFPLRPIASVALLLDLSDCDRCRSGAADHDQLNNPIFLCNAQCIMRKNCLSIIKKKCKINCGTAERQFCQTAGVQCEGEAQRSWRISNGEITVAASNNVAKMSWTSRFSAHSRPHATGNDDRRCFRCRHA